MSPMFATDKLVFLRKQLYSVLGTDDIYVSRLPIGGFVVCIHSLGYSKQFFEPYYITSVESWVENVVSEVKKDLAKITV